jgi:uncharacterized membrane protein
MANALTSGLKTYGEVRTKIGVAVAVFVSIIFLIIGIVILTRKDKHTSQTTGILSNVSCSSNACSATALYNPSGSPEPSPSPSPSPYTLMGSWPINSKEGQAVTVYYDPANPSDASQGPVPKMVGWILIVVAIIIVAFSVLFMKFFSGLSNQGKALVGGFQAAGNISSFLSKN